MAAQKDVELGKLNEAIASHQGELRAVKDDVISSYVWTTFNRAPETDFRQFGQEILELVAGWKKDGRVPTGSLREEELVALAAEAHMVETAADVSDDEVEVV